LNASLLLSLTLIALGVAANPPGIVVQIGLLSTFEGRTKGLVYLAGLLTSILVFGLVAVAIFGRVDLAAKGAPSTAALVIELVAGVLVIGVGLWMWRQPAQAVGGFIGKALNDLDGIKLWTVFILGFLLVNYPLEIAGATTIMQAKLPTTAMALGYFLFFAVIASSTIWIPVGLQAAFPSRWDEWSGKAKDWMVKDGNVVLGALICVIGAAIVLKAALALAGA
jgi:hypothetical protein